jgi:hypothetical protein
MPEEETHLRDFLAHTDYPCPGCGYNLRGLPDPVCPECRQELELTVGLTEPHSGALFLAVGSFFAGAGAAGALLAAVVIISIVEKGFPDRTNEIMILLVIPSACLLTCGLPALRLSRKKGRVWFRKLAAGRHKVVVAIALGLPSAWFAVFLMSLMRMM